MPFNSHLSELTKRPLAMLSEDDFLVKSRSIDWVLSLLSEGIPLNEELLNFVYWLLLDDLDQLISLTEELVERNTLQRITPKQQKMLLEGFEHVQQGALSKTDALMSAIKVAPQLLESPFKKTLREQLVEMKALYSKQSKGNNLELGKRNMCSMLGLNALEAELCMLIYIVGHWKPAENFFDDYLRCVDSTGNKTLATMLGITSKEVRIALNGRLDDLGIVDFNNFRNLDESYECFFDSPDPKQLTKKFYSPMQGSPLPLDHFIVPREKLDLVRNLLCPRRNDSTHILLYGAPGTGKTSFAHSLAHSFSQSAYKVTIDKDNSSETRRASVEACLHMTDSGNQALVVVDEADMLLNTTFSYLFSGERSDKGWLNELLDKPGVRMVWITNDISGVEDSVLRRFSYSMQFKPLNLRKRKLLWERILRKHRAKALLADAAINELAINYRLSAGSIFMAVTNAKQIAGKDKTQFQKVLMLSLDASETLLEGGRKKRRKQTIEPAYSLEGLALDGNIASILKQVTMFDEYLSHRQDKRQVNMNLLFHGPPGTGKTELARYIAHHLKRKLLIKRSSDILGPYVGMTEQNIAAAFHEAEDKEAILVVDEADSLLFSRDLASRSWETSQVNEFLTQMEDFRGLLICTTNRLSELDTASLRRFNHKIGFDYLTPEGNRIFYKKMLLPLTLESMDNTHWNNLESITNLTPGDFKIARDRFVFYEADRIGHSDFIQALGEEAKLKRTFQPKPIGFKLNG